MTYKLIVILALLFISFIGFAFSIDFNSLKININNKVKVASDTIDKTIETGKMSKLGKIIRYTDDIIINSNIKIYINYNVFIHFFMCVLCSILSFLWIKQYMNLFVSLLFSIIGLLLPYSFLQLIANYMNFKVQRYSVDFLITFKNFFIATGDIFIAFEKSSDYFVEPIRTYCNILSYEYKNGVNPIRCLENFTSKIRNEELHLFMQNLIIAYKNGSDILALITEFTDQLSNINDDLDKEETEDKILNLGLYILLAINYFVIYIILNSSYKLEITNTISGQIVFIIDILTSFYIIYMTLDKNY